MNGTSGSTERSVPAGSTCLTSVSSCTFQSRRPLARPSSPHWGRRSVWNSPDDIQSYHTHHRWNIRTGSLTESQKKYYRFTFTRDPFARLASCYRDKILLASDAGHRAEYYDRYIFDLPGQLSFAEFAERVSRIPDPLADPHFRSQYALLYRDGELQVDFVGKIEELDHQWKPIAARYDLDPRLERVNVTRANADRFDHRILYTEPVLRLVHERYRQDVEVLGYQKEYENMLNSVAPFQA